LILEAFQRSYPWLFVGSRVRGVRLLMSPRVGIELLIADADSLRLLMQRPDMPRSAFVFGDDGELAPVAASTLFDLPALGGGRVLLGVGRAFAQTGTSPFNGVSSIDAMGWRLAPGTAQPPRREQGTPVIMLILGMWPTGRLDATPAWTANVAFFG
jgi:hypothetical protein